MSIKSNYLIHWTGKDICKSPGALSDAQRDVYVNRLEGTIEKGLWMTPCSGDFVGSGGSGFKTWSQVTCFTENRLEYYRPHTERYGLMGLGFSREWVLDRDGLPVFYLRGGAQDIHSEIIAGLSMSLGMATDQESYRRFSLLMDYTKPMSSPGTSDFSYLEEAEWRIVWNSRQGKNFVPSQSPPPEFHIPFSASDLKLLIMPDNLCRKKAFSNPRIFNFIQSGGHETLVLSLEEALKL